MTDESADLVRRMTITDVKPSDPPVYGHDEHVAWMQNYVEQECKAMIGLGDAQSGQLGGQAWQQQAVMNEHPMALELRRANAALKILAVLYPVQVKSAEEMAHIAVR